MNKYESVIILKPTLKKDDRAEILKETEKAIKEVANIIETNDIGLRKLAYEVNGYKEGFYMCYKFDMKEELKENETSITNIERYFRKQEEIMKFLIVERE